MSASTELFKKKVDWDFGASVTGNSIRIGFAPIGGEAHDSSAISNLGQSGNAISGIQVLDK